MSCYLFQIWHLSTPNPTASNGFLLPFRQSQTATSTQDKKPCIWLLSSLGKGPNDVHYGAKWLSDVYLSAPAPVHSDVNKAPGRTRSFSPLFLAQCYEICEYHSLFSCDFVTLSATHQTKTKTKKKNKEAKSSTGGVEGVHHLYILWDKLQKLKEKSGCNAARRSSWPQLQVWLQTIGIATLASVTVGRHSKQVSCKAF